MSTEPTFSERSDAALKSAKLRHSFRGAMDFLRQKRRDAVADIDDLESLRAQGERIRADAVARLPELLEQLESNCVRNGINVHWAESGTDANTIISGIAIKHGAKLVIKGKSMASEEIHLNQHLESLGIETIESDMGEYIVQLDHETPSHIIMPAIHKSKEDIAELFENKLGIQCDAEDVNGMIAVGRQILREKFYQADIGISGVNFAIAETGTLCLVENEGNGRMSTTVPPVHIAIMGIEKVIPSLHDLAPLQKLLTRSATGQKITTYLNLISRPRQPEEKDGPEEVHLVILDNGRSHIHQDDALQETLSCIRCGACMNHCPVYTKIGGHAYGSTYPGPIGQVVMPQIEGMEKHGDLLEACSLNGACGEACPVNIELPRLIRTLRDRKQNSKGRLSTENGLWHAWSFTNQRPRLYRTLLRVLRLSRINRWMFPKAWTRSRMPPKPAKRSLHEIWQAQDKERGQKHDGT